MNKLSKHLVITVAAAVCIVGALTFNQVQGGAGPKRQPPKTEMKLPEVAVVQAQVMDVQASIQAYGEVQARYRLQLSAEVSGKVSKLADKFATGKRFKQGEILATLEQQPYQQALANARLTLANAELALLQEQRNSNQALAEWQRSGLAEAEVASDLVLRKPQLKAAEAQVEYARQALEKAEYDLAQTEIRAPFNAVVVSRDIQPGSYVQAGAQIASLYSTDVAEVKVMLSEQQWLNAPDMNQSAGYAALLSSQDGLQHWSANISRVEAHLDSSSRQRALVLSVIQPLAQKQPLHDGTFVDVRVTGKALTNVWKLPASALTQQGNVWYVDNKQQLQHFVPKVRFSQGNDIYVEPLAGSSQLKVVAKPLSSYLQGMQVTARVEGAA